MTRRAARVVCLLAAVATMGIAMGALAVTPAAADASFTVDTTIDAPDANPGDAICATATQTCSLRAVLAEITAADVKAKVAAATTTTSGPSTTSGAAAAPAVPTSVVVPSGTYDFSAGPIIMSGHATITGAGVDATNFVVGTGARVFEVTDGAIDLSALTISGEVGAGVTSGGVAILASESDVTMRKVTIRDIGSDGDGGAIQMAGGTLVIDDSDIKGNGGNNGGAISAAHVGVTITNSRFSDNGAVRVGGAFLISYPTALSIHGSTFTSNSSAGDGGAIYLEGAAGTSSDAFDIADSTFVKNTAIARGGAIFVRTTSDGLSDRTIRISKSTFIANDGGSGGAIAMARGDLAIEGSTFSSNRATSGSGGALLAAGSLSVKGSHFDINETTESGGAIASAGMVTIGDSTFTKNRASSLGGALSLSGTNAPEVRASTFDGNVADTGGGAIWRADAGLAQTGNTFTSNQPAGDDVKMATYQVDVEKRLASGAGGTKTASPDDGDSVIVLAAVGGASLVIIILVIVVLMRRRGRAGAA